MLKAYEYRCVIRGFDVLLGSVSIALGAAHLRWLQAWPGDREQSPGALRPESQVVRPGRLHRPRRRAARLRPVQRHHGLPGVAAGLPRQADPRLAAPRLAAGAKASRLARTGRFLAESRRRSGLAR